MEPFLGRVARRLSRDAMCLRSVCIAITSRNVLLDDSFVMGNATNYDVLPDDCILICSCRQAPRPSSSLWSIGCSRFARERQR